MKSKQRSRIFSYISILLLITIHTLIFAWVWYTEYLPMLLLPFYRRGSYVILLLFVLFFTVSNHLFGGLKMGYYKIRDSVVARTLSLLTSYATMYLIISLLSYRFVPVKNIIIAILAATLFNVLWSMLSNYIYYKINPPRQMLLVYGDSPIDEIQSKLSSRREKYSIAESVHYNIGEDAIKQLISKHEAVVLHDLSATLRNHLIKYCYETSTRVYVTPKLYDILIRGASDMDLFDTPFLLMRNRGLTPLQTFGKRCMDLILSVTCLVITSPVLLLIVILMKCFDRGPVLYRQTRLTKNGKTFEILKFRSMYVDAEKDAARLQSKNDSRITPMGRVLRRTHLDELPQLINIIKGEMSFVGPRPERPEIAKLYEEQIPEFTYRLKMKAGLTGYAQVYGKYNSTPYDKLKLDLTYIQNYSVFLDLRLLLLTGKTLFLPDHAEGISADRVTALRSEFAATKEEHNNEENNGQRTKE